jgi:hypothetical protein
MSQAQPRKTALTVTESPPNTASTAQNSSATPATSATPGENFHRGGGSWQDPDDCTLLARYQTDYEDSVHRRKGRAVVRKCAAEYLFIFEAKCRAQFETKIRAKAGWTAESGEPNPAKSEAEWKKWCRERTEVCL